MAFTQWRKASQCAQTETRWAVRYISSPLAARLAEAEEWVPRLVFLSGHGHGGLERREVVVKHKRSSVLVVDLNKSANTTSPVQQVNGVSCKQTCRHNIVRARRGQRECVRSPGAQRRTCVAKKPIASMSVNNNESHCRGQPRLFIQRTPRSVCGQA